MAPNREDKGGNNGEPAALLWALCPRGDLRQSQKKCFFFLFGIRFGTNVFRGKLGSVDAKITTFLIFCLKSLFPTLTGSCPGLLFLRPPGDPCDCDNH